MSKQRNRLVGLCRLLFAFLLLFSLFAAFSAPAPRAYATDPDEICVPRHNGGVPDGWFSARYINRAIIEVTYTANGDCASPGGDAEYVYGRARFANLMNGKYVDRNTADPEFEYVKTQDGGSSDEESRLDQFDGNLDDGDMTGDEFGGNDAIVDPNVLKRLFEKVEFVMGFEEDLVTADCEDKTNANWMLYDDGDGFRWYCGSTVPEGVTGFRVGGLITNLDNFNITYGVVGTGEDTVIRHVSESEQDTRTFGWCPSLNRFVADGCDSSSLYIEASIDEIAAIGEGVRDLTIRKEGIGSTLTVKVAGADSELGGDSNSSGGDQNDAEEEDNSCESNGGIMGWIMCPVAGVLDSITGFLDSQIQQKLYIKQSYFEGDSGKALKAVWVQMRNFAYIILIPIMLVMVLGTALGFEFFSAYTVKRALPRMVIAIIFITLSWYICVFMVEFINVVGTGIRGLVVTPFQAVAGEGGVSSSLKDALDAAGVFNAGGEEGSAGTAVAEAGSLGLLTLVGAGVAFAVGAVSLGIILSTLFSAALILGAVFLLLILRQMILIALLLVAPLAILAWIFPGNDSMWKLWWKSFSRLLLVFPLIMLISGVGQVFAYVTGISRGAAGDMALISAIIIVFAYVMPYIFIPFAFKWAGGVFGNLAGMVNDKNRGLLDRGKKKRAETRAENMQKAKNYGRFSDRNAITRGLNTMGGGLANGPRTWTPGRTRAARSGRGAIGAAEALKNDAVYQANQNDDKFLLALGDAELAKKKMDASSGEERAAWQTAFSSASLVKSRNSNATKLASLNALAATGYQYSAGQKGYNELAGSIAKVTGAQLTRDASNNVTGATGAGAGAFANAMNSAQYGMKGAGRLDLAGINNGAGWDPEAGLGKASLYQLANGKKQSITAMTEKLGAGPLAGSLGHEAAITYQELQAMKPNATGAVAAEIDEQMLSLEDRGVKNFMSQASGRTAIDPTTGAVGPAMVERRSNFDADLYNSGADPTYNARWGDPAERARGWRQERRIETNADIAQAAARTYQRPDPNNMD